MNKRVDVPSDAGGPNDLQAAMAMAAKDVHYIAFMLRLWRVKQNGEHAWRASLESPSTGERRGFANLEELFAFLATQTREQTQRGS